MSQVNVTWPIFTRAQMYCSGWVKVKLTGSCAKACGKMEDSASQALICTLLCCSFCKALFRGPLKMSVQNCTTYIRSSHNLLTVFCKSHFIALLKYKYIYTILTLLRGTLMLSGMLFSALYCLIIPVPSSCIN